jgi:hypothetical protein
MSGSLIWKIPYGLSIPVVQVAAEIVHLVSKRGHVDVNEKGPPVFWDPYVWNNKLKYSPRVPKVSLLVIFTYSPNIARYFDVDYGDYEGVIAMRKLLRSMGCYALVRGSNCVVILPRYSLYVIVEFLCKFAVFFWLCTFFRCILGHVFKSFCSKRKCRFHNLC